MKQVGVVSPDALHMNKLPTDPGAQPCSPCYADMRDARFHERAVKLGIYDFCSDMNGNGAVAIDDGVTIENRLKALSSCVSDQGACVEPVGGNPDARIALHGQLTIGPNCPAPAALGVSYSDINTSLPLQTGTWVYLLAARGNPTAGIAGLSFGISLDETELYGEWHGCAYDLGGPGGYKLFWSTNNCQQTTVGSDGVHAIAASFYAYAYEPTAVGITPFPGELYAQVMDCAGQFNDVPGCLGVVGFGFDGSDPARPVLPTTCEASNSSSTGTVWTFTAVPKGVWSDPPLAYGYEYSMTSGSLFTKVLDFPPGFAASLTVSVEGVVIGDGYSAGESVVFADHASELGPLLINGVGVQRFEITEVLPWLDENDPLGFPIKLDFDTQTADFEMTPLLGPATTSVPDEKAKLRSALMAENYPNPFAPATQIRYRIPRSSPVSVTVFDIQGNQVRALLSGLEQDAGEHTLRWDGRDEAGRDLPAGVYLYRIVAADLAISRKMVLMR
jgi:hypothetical protein